MTVIIFKPEPCKACGRNQWLAPDEINEKPELPEVPLSGRGRKAALSKITRIEKAWKKKRKEMKKNAICAVCLVQGGASVLSGSMGDDMLKARKGKIFKKKEEGVFGV